MTELVTFAYCVCVCVCVCNTWRMRGRAFRVCTGGVRGEEGQGDGREVGVRVRVCVCSTLRVCACVCVCVCVEASYLVRESPMNTTWRSFRHLKDTHTHTHTHTPED